MQTIINNDLIQVTNPSSILLSRIKAELHFVDKSKQYQIKRMSRNPYSRNSPLYAQLLKEVEGNLFILEGNTLKFSSSFFDIYKDRLGNIIDKRASTGTTIALPWVVKPHPMRDYQDECVELMVHNNRGLICAATGLGKSLIMINAIKRIIRKTLIIVPSESIASQFYDSLVSAFGKNRVALFGKGKKKIADITVGIAASVTRNIDLFQTADLGLVMFDETHMIAANTFFDIAQGLAKVGQLFGLTATDFRSDGKDIMITAGCGPVLINRDVCWGIDNGWLAIPSFIVREINTGGKDIKDDKLKSYKEHILNNPIMKARIEGDARSMMAAGKSVLILVDEVAHGEELSKNLGIPFATGEDKKSQSYLDDLNAGRVPGLVGTDGKIGQGSDTRNVDVLIMAQFTASRGPVIQAVGRALRKQGLKTKALILDYKIVDSTMLNRHAQSRIGFYQDITDKVKVIKI